MMAGREFAIAVLAGGEGSRIGGAKPMIVLDGKTLIERAYDRALHWSNRVVVSLRSADQVGPFEMPSIADAPDIQGPLAGLVSALQWAGRGGATALLTIPCDMPFLPDDLPVRLLSKIGDQNAAIAASGGSLHPVCGLWSSGALAEIACYCASGKRSLQGFARHVGFIEVEWPVVPHDPFFNINSQADLAVAKEMFDD